MNTKIEMAQDKFIEGVGKLAESFGMNKFFAQLYAVLYLSNKPLSLDDMAERLRVSKGNISLNIRELENWGIVKNVWVKGSRKDYYEVDPDIKKAFMKKFKSSIQKRIGEVSGMIEEFKEIIGSAKSELTEEEKKIVESYHAKLKKIEELKSLASKIMVVAEKFF